MSSNPIIVLTYNGQGTSFVGLAGNKSLGHHFGRALWVSSD